jgi:phosphohistidine phosphatase
MKTLYLVRHAKSSWDDPGQGDFDRPLNERGKRDAPNMGKRLKEKEINPDLMLSSPARRALSTCKRIAEALGYANEKIKTNRQLYHPDEETILSVIQNLKDKYDSVMIFSHNPALTDFTNAFRNDEMIIENIPTCSVVAFQIETDSWRKVRWRHGRFLFFDFPKSKT